MSRDGSGVYTKAVGTTAIPNTVIESAKYNAAIDDIAADLNFPRPVVAGGTGSTTALAAQDALKIGERVLEVGSVTAVASKVFDLTAYIADGWEEFELVIRNWVPTTDNVSLFLTVSTNSGSSFLATAYSNQFQNSEGANTTSAGSASTTQFTIGTNHGNVSLESDDFIIRLDCNNAIFFYLAQGLYWNATSDVPILCASSGRNIATVNAVKLSYSSGNITSGTYVLRGKRVIVPV